MVQGLDLWEQVLRRANILLAEEKPDAAWVSKMSALATESLDLAKRDADMAVYWLIQSGSNDLAHYSSNHAMACMVITMMIAERLQWTEQECQSLANAALSMNLSITKLQDQLAMQNSQLLPTQRAAVDGHSAASANLLSEAGITDALMLETVKNHHVVNQAAPMAATSPAEPRLAEMLRRIDIYTARLTPRGLRESMSPALAARDVCLGPDGKPDELGALLLKTIGLYPPGTYVELENGETSVVTQRGEKSHQPIVASLRRPDQGLLMPPLKRDTTRSGFGIKNGLQPAKVRVLLDHRRVLSSAR